MSVVKRHKKPGGFRNLVNSLETTPPERRRKILDSLRSEDPKFTDAIEKCIFDFNEFIRLDDMAVCELMGAMAQEMRTVAIALFNTTDRALIRKFTANMQTPELRAYRDACEMFKSVLPREQMAARFRIIVKARELEQANRFTLKKIDESYVEGTQAAEAQPTPRE